MTSQNEIQNFEANRNNIIVFAAEPVVASAILPLVAQGFPVNRIGNGNNETVTTIFNDQISFSLGGNNYLIDLAQAISTVTGKEVYVRLEGMDFSVTPDGISRVDAIPEPIAVRTTGMTRPAKGWAGATRDSLWRAVKRFGNKAILEEMKKFMKNARPSEQKRIIKIVLAKHGITL